jgi:arsenate reductase
LSVSSLQTPEDWGLDDPTGKSDEEFMIVIKTIEEKVIDLKNRIPSINV